MDFNVATIIFILPALVTVIVLRIRKRAWGEIFSGLGWRVGPRIYLLWALLLSLAVSPLGIAISLFVSPDFYRHPSQGTTLYTYARLGLGVFTVLRALLNEFFFTALGEEVFFRGLLGGWLIRRFGFLLGNTLQTAIFLLPHLLILLVDVKLWPLLFAPLLLGWVNGWLCYKSGSILPGMIVHALGNTASDVMAMLLGGG